MPIRFAYFASLAFVAAFLSADHAAAQGGGYGSQLTEQLRTQSIGTGYTGASLNAISLRNAQAQSAAVGLQGSGVVSSSVGSGPGVSSLGPSAKPFSSISQTPTVSPYLQLFDEDNNDINAVPYLTRVRPQLQQQEANQSFQRQTQALNQRVQQISAQPAFNPQGSTQQSPTGHPTTFGYYSHFYPSKNGRR
ncbi:hypothetical protein Mal64_16450 [Pseudobythopirellula maris]|uniref:Uncharacterized protein n=1 Tax=Pseudobythopirellula maris TaxID=2527991 RepID=A0A5C5ZLT3_9BACT|nr:hypothetical protein [Pseudobythopirellula maris]TWT88168.1 hypothetical protein Mal64_16450 [Pseudobythopirellula maris]